MNPTPPPAAPAPRRRWPWALLAAAMAWAALLRSPLIVNAGAHLDSDLAVDGLTLLEATRGHWRWHFPGTPHIGIGPLLACLPQAMLWGASPATLVAGGLVQYELVVLATFLLAWRLAGPKVAAWALVPLAFASTGTIWLSGRLTGGHLLAPAWHAVAFLLLYEALTRGGALRAVALGLWCGLGLYLDTMLAFTVAALVPAAVVGWLASGRSLRGAGCALLFLAATAAGYLPHVIGKRADPHDAYPAQFEPTSNRELWAGHARILALECLPRLVAGHLLPDLRAEPDPRTVGGPRPPREEPPSLVPPATSALALALFGLAMVSLGAPGGASSGGGPARAAVRYGLLAASAGVVVAFVANVHIYNSDNYRYLVLLLVPWALGFGLAMERLARRGRAGAVAAIASAATLAALITADAARWYDRLGWLGPDRLPARRPVVDPLLGWLREHPGVTFLVGDYWDVYRLSFLTGGRVKGKPYSSPDRFPGWGEGQKGGSRAVVVRTMPGGWVGYEAEMARRRAIREGGTLIYRSGNVLIYSWP